jgi:hypothetical protein
MSAASVPFEIARTGGKGIVPSLGVVLLAVAVGCQDSSGPAAPTAPPPPADQQVQQAQDC